MISGIKTYLATVGFGGLCQAVKGRLTKSPVYYQLKRPDCRFPFRVRLPSSDVRAYRQIFIDQEYDFQVDTPPKVIIDAGANIGLASIYFANRYPEAKIIAIEPERTNFELLKENVAPYSQIIPLQAALWNKNEEIDLIDPGQGNWAFMTTNGSSSDAPPNNARHKVKALTIDQILQDYGLAKVDILKIDIEGAEKEVFNDSSSWIDKVDSLIVELHERMKSGCNRSFYCGSNGFDREWQQGENVYLSRGNRVTSRSA